MEDPLGSQASRSSLSRQARFSSSLAHCLQPGFPRGRSFAFSARSSFPAFQLLSSRAAQFVGTNKIVGVHYDTFPPIKIDHAAAKSAATKAGKELLLPKIGETIEKGEEGGSL